MIEFLKRRGVGEDKSWQPVDDVNGGEEGINPKPFGQTGVS
jgi:hypothetical protein